MNQKILRPVLVLLLLLVLFAIFAGWYKYKNRVVGCSAQPETAGPQFSVMIDGKPFVKDSNYIFQCNRLHIYSITMKAPAGCRGVEIILPQSTCKDSTYTSEPHMVIGTDRHITASPTRIIYEGNPSDKVNRVTISFRDAFPTFLTSAVIAIHGYDYCGHKTDLKLPADYTGDACSCR